MTLQQMEREGWYGIDGSLDISLYEYGLAAKDNDDGTVDVIVGIGLKENLCGDMNYNKFDRWNHYDADDLPINDSWFKLPEVLRCCGMSEDDWNRQSLINKISDCIMYYGYENIMDTSYGGFEIIDEEIAKQKTKDVLETVYDTLTGNTRNEQFDVTKYSYYMIDYVTGTIQFETEDTRYKLTISSEQI